MYRIQLHARITGSLALDARLSAQDLLVIDYVHQSYVLDANTPALRQDLFGIDLTPQDLQIAVTGRVPQDLFRAGRGKVDGQQASFEADGAEYRFTLDAMGLPTEWSKVQDGVALIRVEYRSYLEVPAGHGVTVRLPERIRVYAAGSPRETGLGAAGSPHDASLNAAHPRLILGVQEWQLAPKLAPISFIPPSDVLEKFRAQ
jgi:hypothetical protein